MSCEAHEGDHHEEENECKEICNPFLSCSCGTGLTNELNQDQLTHEVDNNYALNNRIVQASPSQIIFPIWHPPRG